MLSGMQIFDDTSSIHELMMNYPSQTKDKIFSFALLKQGNAYKICILGVTKDVSSCIVISEYF